MLEFRELIVLFTWLATSAHSHIRTFAHSHSRSLGRVPGVTEGIPMQLDTRTSSEGFASTKRLIPV